MGAMRLETEAVTRSLPPLTRSKALNFIEYSSPEGPEADAPASASAPASTSAASSTSAPASTSAASSTSTAASASAAASASTPAPAAGTAAPASAGPSLAAPSPGPGHRGPSGRVMLEVTVRHGRDLPKVQFIGIQDPYVVVSYDNQEFRTKTCDNGSRDPVFNETFTFVVERCSTLLSLSVMNDNQRRKDDVIGTARVDFILALEQGRTTTAFPILNTQGQHEGTIELTLKCLDVLRARACAKQVRAIRAVDAQGRHNQALAEAKARIYPEFVYARLASHERLLAVLEADEREQAGRVQRETDREMAQALEECRARSRVVLGRAGEELGLISQHFLDALVARLGEADPMADAEFGKEMGALMQAVSSADALRHNKLQSAEHTLVETLEEALCMYRATVAAAHDDHSHALSAAVVGYTGEVEGKLRASGRALALAEANRIAPAPAAPVGPTNGTPPMPAAPPPIGLRPGHPSTLAPPQHQPQQLQSFSPPRSVRDEPLPAATHPGRTTGAGAHSPPPPSVAYLYSGTEQLQGVQRQQLRSVSPPRRTRGGSAPPVAYQGQIASGGSPVPAVYPGHRGMHELEQGTENAEQFWTTPGGDAGVQGGYFPGCNPGQEVYQYKGLYAPNACLPMRSIPCGVPQAHRSRAPLASVGSDPSAVKPTHGDMSRGMPGCTAMDDTCAVLPRGRLGATHQPPRHIPKQLACEGGATVLLDYTAQHPYNDSTAQNPYINDTPQHSYSDHIAPNPCSDSTSQHPYGDYGGEPSCNPPGSFAGPTPWPGPDLGVRYSGRCAAGAASSPHAQRREAEAGAERGLPEAGIRKPMVAAQVNSGHQSPREYNRQDEHTRARERVHWGSR